MDTRHLMDTRWDGHLVGLVVYVRLADVIIYLMGINL